MIYAIVILSVAVLVALGLLVFQSIILSYIEKTSPTDTLMNEPLGSVYAERWILWPKIDTRKGTWNHKHKFALIVNKFYGPDLDANWGFWENGVFTEARKFKGTKTFKH